MLKNLNDLYSTKKILSTTSAFLLVLVHLQAINGAALSVPTSIDRNSSSIYEYHLTTLNDDNLQQLEVKLKGHPAIMAKNEKANLTAITWAHAVNSQSELDETLNSDIDMIEADIVLGKLNNSGDDLPVMAHPPANSSDISLLQFLTQIMAHNQAHTEQAKGIKLDFKSIEVFEGSLEILSDMIPLMSYPIWLNADIISGPVNQNNSVPVDPERFFAGCANFSQAVLSIGWTTRWSSSYSDGAYTPSEIDNMLQAIKRNNVTETAQPITFPVRAGIAANSQEQLHDLVRAVNDTNESSLTIWSSQNDYVDVENLRRLIFSFGFDRVYLDVPEDLSNMLDLGRSSGNRSTLPSLVSFSVISALLLLASLLS